MFIEINAEDDGATPMLHQAEDFNSLKIIMRGHLTRPQEATAMLDTLGRRVSRDHIYMSPATIAELAPAIGNPESWERGFSDMIKYARQSGWLDAHGHVRVHIEYVDE